MGNETQVPSTKNIWYFSMKTNIHNTDYFLYLGIKFRWSFKYFN